MSLSTINGDAVTGLRKSQLSRREKSVQAVEESCQCLQYVLALLVQFEWGYFAFFLGGLWLFFAALITKGLNLWKTLWKGQNDLEMLALNQNSRLPVSFLARVWRGFWTSILTIIQYISYCSSESGFCLGGGISIFFLVRSHQTSLPSMLRPHAIMKMHVLQFSVTHSSH